MEKTCVPKGSRVMNPVLHSGCFQGQVDSKVCLPYSSFLTDCASSLLLVATHGPDILLRDLICH